MSCCYLYQTFPGGRLFYKADDEKYVGVVRDGIRTATHVLTSLLEEDLPAIDVYVTRSGFRFLYHSAPWRERFAFLLYLPVTWIHLRRSWVESGGWFQHYPRVGKRCIAVKSPDCYSDTRSSSRSGVFQAELTDSEIFRLCLGHEVAHAALLGNECPPWLEEGFATLVGEQCSGRDTVIAASADPEAWSGVRGYWLCRFLAATDRPRLRRLLNETEAESTVSEEEWRIVHQWMKGHREI